MRDPQRRFTCPACMTVVDLPASTEGKKRDCPECEVEVRWPRPVRRQRKSRYWLLVGTVAGVVALLAILLAVAELRHQGQKEQAGGVSAGVPDSWTHRELTEHFEKKALGVRFIVLSSGGGVLPPSGYFVPKDSTARNWQDVEDDIKDGATNIAYCELRKTGRDAKDTAGTWGERGFASGRFAFRAPPDTLKRVRDALP